MRVFRVHASVKTTSIYVASNEHQQKRIVAQRERGGMTFDDDRTA